MGECNTNASKSDVWAYGVLCWEVFTCGDMPYGRAKNPEVVERVQRGQILSQPGSCPHQVYEVGGDSKHNQDDDDVYLAGDEVVLGYYAGG